MVSNYKTQYMLVVIKYKCKKNCVHNHLINLYHMLILINKLIQLINDSLTITCIKNIFKLHLYVPTVIPQHMTGFTLLTMYNSHKQPSTAICIYQTTHK